MIKYKIKQTITSKGNRIIKENKQPIQTHMNVVGGGPYK